MDKWDCVGDTGCCHLLLVESPRSGRLLQKLKGQKQFRGKKTPREEEKEKEEALPRPFFRGLRGKAFELY